uniref:1106 effector family protein variant n=1 Tax=Globodera rostochiensis TaxID=31243 RepID=A0A914HKZ7_GLORO
MQILATKPKNAKSTPGKDKKSPATPKTIKAAEPKPESSVPGPSSAPVVAERDVGEASVNDFDTVDDFGAEDNEFDEDNDLAEEEEPLNDDAFDGTADDFSGMGLDQDKPKSNMDE